ncbi:MAG TPA: VOC family protein [Ilumatobacteraceae bacterium]
MIDHLVFASNDLPSASAHIATVLGATPEPGGSHVGRGTYNELLSLGGASYLEVIGPDPAQPAPSGARPFSIDTLTGPALVAWCVRPQRPLIDIVTEARAAGVEFGDVEAMSRRRPDGVLLQWELSYPQLDGPLGRALPFLIDWGGAAHPSDTLTSGVRLIGLDVYTPDTALLRIALDIVGAAADVEVYEAQTAELRARIDTGQGEVSLSS